MLIFDAEKHEYRIDGKLVPSVTQVIGSVCPGWQADPWYLQRGKALHGACHLYDMGTLDWASVDPAIIGRVRAWERFRREWPATVWHSEAPMQSAVSRFAGTPDRIFRAKEQLALVDIKSTAEPQVIVQLGGYSVLARQDYGLGIDLAVAVELHDDGTYRTYPDPWLSGSALRRAEQQFLAFLSVHNFLKAHNLKVK